VLPPNSGLFQNIIEKNSLFLKFPLLDRFFNGNLNKLVVPVIVKRPFRPDYGLYQLLKVIMAGLAKVTMGQMEIIPVHNGLFNLMLTYIASKGFHNYSLYLNF
jgi:hypothetical protein